MLRFEDPIYLYMLLAVPALVLLRLALWRIRKKKLNALGDYALLKQLMPDVSKYRPTVKFYLLVAAYTMLVLLHVRRWEARYHARNATALKPSFVWISRTLCLHRMLCQAD